MSDRDLARRTEAEIAFDGVDITASIRPYLLSLTYTDNEEDTADDLQIKLQDRDGLWLEHWLGDAVRTATSRETATVSAPAAAQEQARAYRVTPQIGLNVRAGPSTSYARLGAFVCGTVIEVSAIENGWAKITYSGRPAYVSAAYIEPTGESTAAQESSAVPEKTGVSAAAMKIQAVLVRRNWHGGGRDELLDCGQFELDAVDVSGPPSVVTVKATALPYSSQVRQTEKSKVWVEISLSGIAKQIAAANSMACLYVSASDPYYVRTEQFKTSDIAFLSGLCHDAGISLKATNSVLVLFDQAGYEARAPVLTLRRGTGGYTKYKLVTGSAGTQYASCRVSYTDPATGACIEGTARVEDYGAQAKNNQQLEVTAKVASAAEAKALAEKHLRLHNKYSQTATFTLPGDPAIAAGVTVQLAGWGFWDGKYLVKQAKHTLGASGYTVQVQLRRVLEEY